jgi:hypothetical protein
MKSVISFLVVFSLMVTVLPVIKVSAQEPDISNNPSSYAFGTLNENASYSTNLDYFTVTNNSGYQVNITIRGSDMTGGISWTLSDNAIPGEDTYGLRAGLYGESYNITVSKTDTLLIGNMTDNSSQQWGLELLSPTSFSDSAQKSGIVTLTATQALVIALLSK